MIFTEKSYVEIAKTIIEKSMGYSKIEVFSGWFSVLLTRDEIWKQLTEIGYTVNRKDRNHLQIRGTSIYFEAIDGLEKYFENIKINPHSYVITTNEDIEEYKMMI